MCKFYKFYICGVVGVIIELMVAFRNFAKAPKTTILRILCYSDIYLNQMFQLNKSHIHIFIVFSDD